MQSCQANKGGSSCQTQAVGTNPIMPAVFVNHGGGPYPILDPNGHTQMHINLQQIGKQFPNPVALIVVSAHWEENQFTLLDEDQPGLLFDYYGFPPQSYQFQYPTGSSKQLRQHVAQHVTNQGINLLRKQKRGYDHGVFIPLMLMFPKANIPVIQISLEASLDPGRHFQLGAALAGLRKQGFMVVGSGMTFHNFNTPNPRGPSKIFDDQLAQLCCSAGSQAEREEKVKKWTQLKFARECHGREEHLIPLFVCLATAEGHSGSRLPMDMLGVPVSDYLFA